MENVIWTNPVNVTATGNSSWSGITWGTSCSGNYASGTVVTLTATPSNGSTFTGWSGGGRAGALVTVPLPIRP